MNPFLLLGLIGAVVFDWKTRKIPNGLTLSLALCGLMFQWMQFGFAGLTSGMSGLVVGGFLLFLPFALGGMGAGDVKLLAAVGAWTGPWGVVQVFLAAAIAGSLLCLAEAARQKKLSKILKNIRARIFSFVFYKTWTVEAEPKTRERLFVPYAAAIMTGYLVVLYLGGE